MRTGRYFLSRFFITKEGRLGKKEIKKTKKILLPQLFPLLQENSFDTLLEESSNQAISDAGSIQHAQVTFHQSDREEWKVGEGIGIDYVLFLLNEEGRLSHPNGIVFFNQSTDTKTGISMEDRGSDIVFSIDLERIRQDSALHSIVDSLLFVAVIDEKCSKTGRIYR